MDTADAGFRMGSPFAPTDATSPLMITADSVDQTARHRWYKLASEAVRELPVPA